MRPFWRKLKRATGSFFVNPRSRKRDKTLDLKERDMKTVFKIAAIAAAATLVACGGGGGGGSTTPPPPPPPTVSGSFTSVAGCTVPDGQSSCNPTITWTTANATSPRVTANGTTVSTLASGTATPSIPVGNTALVLADGNSQLDAKSVTAACADGSAFQNGTCQKVQVGAIHYTDKVIVVWTEGFPFMVGLSGSSYSVTKMANTTGKLLGSCGEPNKPLSDGRLVFECTTLGINTFERLRYLVDPTAGPAGTLSNLPSSVTVPSDITWTAVESNSTQPVANTTSAHVAGGWYYADPNNRARLLFQNDAGGAPIPVKETTTPAEGTVTVIRAYSN
jgi:hypothetical protein